MTILIIAFSSAIMLVITVVQLAFEYRSLRSGLDRELDSVEIYVKSIAGSVWNFDEAQIQLALDGLSRLPYIETASVVALDTGNHWQAGAARSRRSLARSYDLPAPGDRRAPIGRLSVVASLEELHWQVARSALTIVASNALKAILVASFIIYLFRRLVASRLERLARKALAIGPAAGDTGATNGADPPPAGLDEIGAVERALDQTARMLAHAQSQQEQSQARARRSRRQLQQMIDTAMDAIVTVDSRQRITLFNPAAEAMFGRCAEDVMGQDLGILVPAPLRGAHAAHVARFAESGVTNRAMGALGTVRGMRASGEQFPLEAAISQVEVEDERFYSAILRDVTERERAEEALRDSAEKLQLFIKFAPSAIAMFDREMRYIAFSSRWITDYKLTDANITGHSHYEVFPDLPEHWKEVHRRCLAGTTESAEEEFPRADGSVDWVRWEVHPWHAGSGGIGGIIIFSEVITARRQAEQESHKSKAMLEALARRLLEVQESERRSIARELHDEVGGALTAVKLNLQSLRGGRAANPGTAIADGLALVDGALQSIRSLSLDLRPAMLDDLGLIPALKWYCERQAKRSGVAIELALDAIDLEAAPLLESACYRIVQEALTNALRHARARRVQVALRLGNGGFALEITDDGGGFDVAAARRGGLAGESGGLLGMEERTRLLGGLFEIHSAPDAGTRVRAQFTTLVD